MANPISNGTRGAVQFLASCQPLIESPDLDLKIMAVKMLQTAIAYGSGSPHIQLDWLKQLSEFGNYDSDGGEDGYMRHFRPFFDHLTNLEAPFSPESKDKETNQQAAAMSFTVLDLLVEHQNDPHMVEAIGRFTMGFLANFYPYPVKHTDYDVYMRTLELHCPKDALAIFKAELNRPSPFKIVDGKVVSKTDNELKSTPSVSVGKLRRPKKK